MTYFVVAIMLAVFTVQQNNAHFIQSVLRFIREVVIMGETYDAEDIQVLSANDRNVVTKYWNSILGVNNSIDIFYNYEEEIKRYWIPEMPLKVIVHGWLDSTSHEDGVFSIKSAYLGIGGYNVISVDWGGIAGYRNYMYPVMMTSKIGSRLAKLLDNIVKLGMVKPENIHLIGHSLGAHIAGACGSAFMSGRIGRITGLDPAAPGFEFAKLQKKELRKTDAAFVDVIHTAGGSTGYLKSMGHVDFYPNGGSMPQPGCFEGVQGFKELIGLVGCSHSRAYKLYVDSIHNMNSMIAFKCTSWEEYENHFCDDSESTPLGHNISLTARGDYYLKTQEAAPFAVQKITKEDL